MNKPISLNINFDSLNENAGFPRGYKDKSFFEVFDRFLKLADEFNFKYSIYIIGKDLENEEIKARVKEWSQKGHEIGNHSYRHCLNIGGLNNSELQYEILKSHELIHNCTNIEPKGFICPGWSTSSKVLKVLIDNNYLYDTSLFPSPIIYPAIFKNALNHLSKPQKVVEIITRRDYLFPFTKPISAFISDSNYKETSVFNEKKIVVLPLPTLKRFSLAMWHTLLFVFNKDKGLNSLNEFLKQHDYFYYLMHPADLTGENDIDKNHNHTIERMNVDLITKEILMRDVLDMFHHSKRPIITMQEMAMNFIDEKKNSSSV
jgi:peptidoglycan/xylan/chitin deacetylase (PgdA/CDA1 family)